MPNSRLSRTFKATKSFVSHSHTISTRQPSSCSWASFRASRATFPSNFGIQNSCRVLGVVAYLQPGWRCQKQPCTKIAVWCFDKTISGEPGRDFLWRRKRNPKECSSERTINSGFVFALPTRLMMAERESGDLAGLDVFNDLSDTSYLLRRLKIVLVG